jgi:hypothetical protein
MFFCCLLLRAGFSQTEMGFLENKGQLADENGKPLPQVLFKATGTGPAIYITTSGLTWIFEEKLAVADEGSPAQTSWSKIEMELKSASILPENVMMEAALPGCSNFYYPHCPQGISGVKAWHKVTVKNIYPGIDWVLTADNKTGMAHDFIVHPGADPSIIRPQYRGMNGEIVSEKNRLAFHSKHGTLYEGGLFVYEQETGKPVDAAFHVGSKGVAGYDISRYNRKNTLVIDPPLQWSTLQASSAFDYGYAISPAGDGSGDVLITGTTSGSNFPVLNAFQGTFAGIEDIVVVRRSSSGAMIWSTFYGGSDYDGGKGISSDNSGNAYVAGYTMSSDFPVQNPLQANFGGGTYDAVVMKFNSSGVRQWATWRGGIGNDYANAIITDSTGMSYITGYTSSTNFPLLNAVQPAKNFSYDAFIMKLDASEVLQWSTFFGGDDEDRGRAITLDASGTNLYVTGTTLSGGFPATAGCFQNSSGSAYNAEDAFILKMSVSQVVQFCSYCGGSGGDFGQGIAVDISGNIYITGYTVSSNFPIVNPGGQAYVDSTIGSPGTHDAFLVECNSTGSTRVWSTYFGGTAPDLAFGIAYEPGFGVYITGNTASTDFPVQVPPDISFYQPTQGDGGTFNDMFVAWFITTRSLAWSTYYGDANANEGYGICTDDNSNIFITGVDSNGLAVLKFAPSTLAVSEASSGGFAFSHYPDPATQQLFVRINQPVAENVQVSITDLTGRIIYTEVHLLSDGANEISMNVGSLAKGIYTIRIEGNGHSAAQKFVKQ